MVPPRDKVGRQKASLCLCILLLCELQEAVGHFHHAISVFENRHSFGHFHAHRGAVSTVQLHNGDFGRRVHEILLATGLSARRLELEITETALISDLNRTLATLRQLKALGIRIAMDDFGTGYSSLSNLRAFPFDKIKIDGPFIRSVDRNQQGAAIVRAVLGLGQGLGLPVLAEGVETARELEFLAKGAACQEAQGYLIGRPSDIAAFRELTHGLPA